MYITQKEADYLMKLKKRFVDDKVLELGNFRINQSHDLISLNEIERYTLDISCGGINLSKYKFQQRVRSAIILVRLEVEGPPHENPDHEIISCPHIHIYREGFDDRWAYPLDDYPFSNLNDIVTTFEQFCEFCNVTNLPPIQRKF